MAEPFISEIRMFGLNFAVRAWAFCDGQLLPIAQNSALFSLLGTTYGGDGRTSFALPDMRGRVPIHPGTGPGLSSYSLGQKGGAESVTLNTNEIPSHTHIATTTLKAVNTTANLQSPSGAYLAGDTTYATDVGRGAVDMNAGSAATTVANTGNSQAHTNLQPFLAVNFEIALQGLFPSRS